jgi:hypothetical protein
MWKQSLLALLLGYAVAGAGWLFIYGPAKQTAWIAKSGPFVTGFVFTAALAAALGFWILASIGSGLAVAQDQASRPFLRSA